MTIQGDGNFPEDHRCHIGPARQFFIDNLLFRIHFIIEMIWWTGLAPWEFESLFEVAVYLPS